MPGRLELDDELLERWAAGRLRAVREAPYLATALLALRPLVLPTTGTQAGGDGPLSGFPVDQGWRVHIDPERLAVTSPAELAYWLLHQVAHLLRDHHARGARLAGPMRGCRDQRAEPALRWRVAADLEVNDDLPVSLRPNQDLRAGLLALPEGLVAEDYWSRLEGASLAGVKDCGGGATGHPPGGMGAQAAIGTEEARLLREETARRVSRWAKAHDDVPGGWARWADEMFEPVVDWRKELRARIRKGMGSVAGQVDHTYRRRSRRDGVVPDVVLPGIHRPEAVLAVVIDTSQSMSPAQLGRAVAEVDGVIGAAGVARRGVSVLCCDSTAYEASRVVDARELRLLGGGGTSLGDGINAAARLRPRPDVIVVLTDGWTDWPERPPRGCQVVVALVGGQLRPPGWAQVVDIELTELVDGGDSDVGDRT